MSTQLSEVPVVFSQKETGDIANGESKPVGNTTFIFNLNLGFIDQAEIVRQDVVDMELIESRKNEPVVSMEAVFADLGIE